MATYKTQKDLVNFIISNRRLVYTVYPSQQSATVPEVRGNVRIFFKGITNVSNDNTKFARDGRDLIITSPLNQKVTVKNYFSNSEGSATKSGVQTIRFEDYNNSSKYKEVSIIDLGGIKTEGLTFAQKRGTVTGTVFSDTIDMSSVEAPYRNGGLVINGGTGNDVITGTKFNDTILGGKGSNEIKFDFSTTFGQDTVKLTKGETLALTLTNGTETLKPADLTYEKQRNNLVITRANDTDNKITIKDFFRGTYNDSIAKLSINGTDLSDYMSTVANPLYTFSGRRVNGTNYADRITGTAKNDTITGGGGNDIIYTAGGNDTLYYSGDYGQDTVYSEGSSRVTLNMRSFNAEDLSLNGEDLYYSDDKVNDSDDKVNGITYKGFAANPDKTADLYIRVRNKSYHIVNAKGMTSVDNLKNRGNNVYYLTEENTAYNGANSQRGTNTVYSSGKSDLTYNGGNETYISIGKFDNNYSATITKTTRLKINDAGGADTLTLNNKASDMRLFFNYDLTAQETASTAQSKTKGEDLVLYSPKAMSYTSLSRAVKTGTYSGAADIVNYTKDGKIETVTTSDTTLNIDGWKSYVEDKVSEWLTANDRTSVNEVFLRGSRAQRADLTNVFKTATYANYLVKSSLPEGTVCIDNARVTDVKLVDDTLVLKTSDKAEHRYNNYFAEHNDKTYYALDKAGQLTQYTVGTEDAPLKTEGSVTVSDSLGKVYLKFNNKSNTTINFTDKKYDDFYTKDSKTIAYNAGDPLIKKTGKDLEIGSNVIIKDIDRLSTNIKIVDSEYKTKTIITGAGRIKGTFESEIIMGSNSRDIISSEGGNDLIYLGKGNDVLNITHAEKGEVTANNTAEMTGIGGTHTISNNLAYPAVSVYSEAGNDTYNTDLKTGLYIEDYAGKDTLNIKYTDDNLMYLFDVVNPKFQDQNPTIYEDLMICDKDDFTTSMTGAAMSILLGGKTMKGALEDAQGTFGYAWIDDYYSKNQKIETVNIVNDKNKVTKHLDLDYTSAKSDLNPIYQEISSWLSNTDYKSAWDVIENGSKSDMLALAQIYMGSGK